MAVRLKNVDPKRTAVIVVDMQNDFVTPGAPMETPMGTKFVPKKIKQFSG